MMPAETTLTDKDLGSAAGANPQTELMSAVPFAELSRPGQSWLDRMKTFSVSITEGFKVRARAIYVQAQRSEIADRKAYDAASETYRAIKAIREELSDGCKPYIAAFNAAHKASTGVFGEVDGPLEDAYKALGKKLNAYEREQARLEAERKEAARLAEIERQRLIREAEQRRLDEMARVERERAEAEQRELDRLAAEQKARDEAARLASAVQAEAEGATAEEVEHMLATPVVAAEPIILPPPAPVPVFMAPPPPPPPPLPSVPAFARAEGRRKAPERWKAQPDPLNVDVRRCMAAGMTLEIAAKQVLLEAAAKDSSLSWALLVDESGINRDANNKKSMFNLPGFRGYDSSL